jgi:hypothetical protein
MTFLNVLIFFSATSFLIYGIAYFVSSNMKPNLNALVLKSLAINCRFRTMGALGLFIGLQNNTILVLSSGA